MRCSRKTGEKGCTVSAEEKCLLLCSMLTFFDNQIREYHIFKNINDLQTGHFIEVIKINLEQKKNNKIRRIKFALTEQQRNDLLYLALMNNPKHYRLIKTQIESGLRISELCNLAINQINFASKEISIETRFESTRYVDKFTLKTKSSNRIIPMTDELLKILKQQIEKRKNGYVFESNKKGKYSIRSAIRIVNQYARKSKLIGKTIGSHALRRTYASYLLDQGVKISIISRLLGHASIRTTMVYLYDIVDMENYKKVRSVLSKMNKM